jgi:hypothetical protein
MSNCAPQTLAATQAGSRSHAIQLNQSLAQAAQDNTGKPTKMSGLEGAPVELLEALGVVYSRQRLPCAHRYPPST